MAELLTENQMEFLAKKLGYKITYLSNDSDYKHYSGDRAILSDGTLRSIADTDDPFWVVSFVDVNDYLRDYEFELLINYVRRNTAGKRCSYSYIKLIPKNFVPACKKYFGGTPLYVGTKRVNQAICKVGGYSRRYKVYTSSKGATSKRSCRAGVV